MLLEIPRAWAAAVSPFAWGAADCLPFLPRVRYGRSVLAPARWRVQAGELPGADAPWPAWAAAMAAVRARLRLPANVQVGGSDRWLRLNLDEAMDLAVLRTHLGSAANAATVVEAPTVRDHGWLGGRAHEIVIPLASTTPPAPTPAVVTRLGPLPLIGREHGMLPGSQVLFAKMYGHPEGFDQILTGYLPGLLSSWEQPPMWWFVRYRDPDPHLRLRLRLADGDYGPAAARVGEWAAELRRCGLIGELTLDTYHPETPRYGSGAVLAAAEAVFAADSAAALAQLTARASACQVHPHALTAASLVDLASALAGSLPAGMRRLIEHPEAGHACAYDREVLRQAISLADGDGAALRAIPGGPRITAAWQVRRRAAATYADCLASDSSHLSPASVLVSLLHLHHVRAYGVNTDSERLCYRLARAVALAWTARHTTTQAGSAMTLLETGLTRHRLRVAGEAAARLTDALAVPPPQEIGDDRSPASPRWRGQSLSTGAAGVAVLHGARAHAGLGSWERVHAWLACATRENLTAGVGAGLWFGTAAVAFAVSTVVPPGQYPRVKTVLDAAVAKMVRARLDAASARMAAAVRPSLCEFDVVHGLAGLGAYLLRHDSGGELVRQVLAYLVELTEPVPAADQAAMSVPGWWTSGAPSGQPPDTFRGGHADLGMAHGISGPLALLALAMRQGIIVDGQVAAIDRICRWLDAWCHDGPAGPWWPERVSLIEQRTGLSTDPRPGWPSWCYGTPGLARAQQLAGHATGDHARQRLAEHALAKCISDPSQLARITDPPCATAWRA
ncbi:MAG: thiopeptide-type bacteriocin biosynthesis protein [Pseudonocardiaceae bacterium]